MIENYLIKNDDEKIEKSMSTAEKILAIALAISLLIGGLYIADSINRFFKYPDYNLIRQKYISADMESEIQLIRAEHSDLFFKVQQKTFLESQARINYEKAREEYRTLLDRRIDDVIKRLRWEQARDYLERTQKDKEVAETLLGKFQAETLNPREKAFRETEQEFRKEYNRQLSSRNLKSGASLLIYAIVGFILSFLIYNFFRTKVKFSQYVVIGLSFLVFGALQALIVSFRIAYPFLQGIIPVSLIVSAGGIIISIIGIVYLRNKFFSLQALRNRRIWKKACPICGFSNPDIFCEWCGSEQLTECSYCKKLTNKYFPHCKECGKKIVILKA